MLHFIFFAKLIQNHKNKIDKINIQMNNLNLA